MSPDKALLPQFLNDLDGASARICLAVEKFSQNHIGALTGKSFILAVSGGADSVAMAIIFNILASRHAFILHCAHVNHGLRMEAAIDENFVIDLCERLNMPCSCAHIDVKAISRENSRGIEEAGRLGRYEALENIRSRQKADFILTAHHAGDLGEDIIMRLVRGCGWPALGGMSPLNGNIFRPLFRLDPRLLRSMLVRIGQEWREDASNLSEDFRRNRIRKNVMPELYRENPYFDRTILNLRDMANIDTDFLVDLLAPHLAALKVKRHDGGMEIFLPLANLQKCHKALRLRLFAYVIDYFAASGVSTQPRCETIFKLDEAFVNRRSGKIFQFAGNVSAVIARDGVIFSDGT